MHLDLNRPAKPVRVNISTSAAGSFRSHPNVPLPHNPQQVEELMIKALLCLLVVSQALFAAQHKINLDLAPQFKEGVWQGEWEEREGFPRVPVYHLAWLIPANETIKKVTMRAEGGSDGPSPMQVQMSPRYLPMCDVQTEKVSDYQFREGEVFPNDRAGKETVFVKHGYHILSLPIYPIQYLPSQEIGATKTHFTVTLETRKSQNRAKTYIPLPSDVEDVTRLIANPQNLKTYPKPAARTAKATYLVVGPDAYLKDRATWDLLEQKSARGMSVSTHSLEKIEADSEGDDLQEKVRNAIQKHYSEDGTRYVLLIGNGYSILPTRNFSIGNESIGSDLYFGCFDGDLDLNCEVAVGRAPVSSIENYRTFVKKTLDAKKITVGDAQAKNALLFGEQMDGSTLASDALEKLAKGGSAGGGISTQGYPDSSEITRLRETFSKHYTASEVIETISSGNFYTINHMGHASQSYCMRLKSADISSLTNSVGFFSITQGCHPGDMHGANWAQKMVLHPTGGAFAQIANSSFGWYQPGSSDGPSNRHSQVFYDAVFSEGIRELGRANMRAKERLASQANSNQTIKKVLVETNLFGDPEFALQIPQ